MLGPQPSTCRYRNPSDADDGHDWPSGRTDSHHEECEFCESVTRTHRSHGMTVCRTCDQQFLP